MQCWPHTVEASCCICRSFQVHVLQWRFKNFSKASWSGGQVVTVEIFAVSFFVYVNGNPVSARFRGWVGVAHQGKWWHDAGRHSVSGIGAQEVGSQQTFEDFVYLSVVHAQVGKSKKWRFCSCRFLRDCRILRTPRRWRMRPGPWKIKFLTVAFPVWLGESALRPTGLASGRTRKRYILASTRSCRSGSPRVVFVLLLIFFFTMGIYTYFCFWKAFFFLVEIGRFDLKGIFFSWKSAVSMEYRFSALKKTPFKSKYTCKVP